MLRQFLRWWQDYTGDRDLDRAIRAELRKHHYRATSAAIRNLRLAAIARPGWIQVYRFEIETTKHESKVNLYGVARDDTRGSSIAVALFKESDAREKQLDIWSESLIRRNG